jgi:large subunit ribosomal protein L18
MAVVDKKMRLRRRHLRIRKKISGTPERPRLSVHRSNRHILVSLIDDTTGRTLLCVTTTANEFASPDKETKTDKAARLGLLVAQKAKELGIETVVFDRGGHPYHGRVRALAEKAREAGLRF